MPRGSLIFVLVHAGNGRKLQIPDGGEIVVWRKRGSSKSLMQERCRCDREHSLGQVPFRVAWDIQHQLVQNAREKWIDEQELVPDVAILLQHNPVFTLGSSTEEENLLYDKNSPPFEVVQVDRGGKVTFHGPGQLVMYLIINLRRYGQDVHLYLRLLEDIAINTSEKVLQAFVPGHRYTCSRMDGMTGAWVNGEKVCAIGVKIKSWITFHGLALNVSTELDNFREIVPCGIVDKNVTSLRDLILRAKPTDHCFNDNDLLDVTANYLTGSILEALQPDEVQIERIKTMEAFMASF